MTRMAGAHLEPQRAAVRRYFEKHGDKLLDYAKRWGHSRWVTVGKERKLDITGELAAVAIVGDTYGRAMQTGSEFRGLRQRVGSRPQAAQAGAVIGQSPPPKQRRRTA